MSKNISVKRLCVLSLSSFLLSGCSIFGVKLIERVPDDSNNQPEVVEQVDPENDSWENEGIVFSWLEEVDTYYALTDLSVSENALSPMPVVFDLLAGEEVLVEGLSKDESIAYVSKGELNGYISIYSLSLEPIEVESDEPEEPEDDSANEPEESSDEQNKEEENKEEETSTSEPTEESEEPEDQSLDEVIMFPTNPSGVTTIGGSTFAESDIQGEIRTDTTIYSAPNVNSHDAIRELSSGVSVRVIGIGSNGFLRVELDDNTIGFVDGIYVKKID